VCVYIYIYIYIYICICTRSRDSSVSVVIRLRTGRPKNHASVPGRDDIYFPQNVKTVCKAHPITYLMGTMGHIPGGVKSFVYM